MRRAVLTEYLLRLTTDQQELDRFQSSEAEAIRAMSEAGLTPEQTDMLLKRDAERIQEAITAEVRGSRGGGIVEPPEIEHTPLWIAILLETPTGP